MKFSCSSSVLAAAGATDFTSLVDSAAALGCGALDLACGADGILTPEHFSFRDSGAMVCHAQAKQVEIQCLSGGELATTSIDAEWDATVRRISMAHALACPLVALTTPLVLDEATYGEEYDRLIGVLHELLDFARDLNICLGIESAPGSFAAGAAETADLVEDTARGNLGIIHTLGAAGAVGQEECRDAAALAQDCLLYVRLAGPDAGAIAGGMFDVAIRALHAASFGGYIGDCSVCSRTASAAEAQRQMRANLAHMQALCGGPACDCVGHRH